MLTVTLLLATGGFCWRLHQQVLRNECELTFILRNDLLNAMTALEQAALSADPTERMLLKLSAINQGSQATSIIVYLDRGPEGDAGWLDTITNLTLGKVTNTTLDLNHKSQEADAVLQGQADLLKSFLPLLEETEKLPNAYPQYPIPGGPKPIPRSLFRDHLREFIKSKGLNAGPGAIGALEEVQS